jgi:hypothetical protein
MTKRKTVFSLNPTAAAKTETVSWEPRQQFFFCVVFTGSGLQWERRCRSTDQAFLNFLLRFYMGSCHAFVGGSCNKLRFGHFID